MMAIRARSDSPRYGIVGDGRLARHIACYFSFLSIPFRRWHRRSGLTPSRSLSGCDVVLLLISDSAIDDFIRKELAGTRQTLVHCSGALSTPLAQGFHPLMTFGPELLSLEEYSDIPFICEEGSRPFRDVFPELRNPHHEIPRGSGPLYHSLAVMSGNFSVMLWRKLFREFEDRLGLPAQAALPYLRRVFRNIESDPEAALTGPLQRGDRATIAKNLEALAGDPFARVYESFVMAAEKEGQSCA